MPPTGLGGKSKQIILARREKVDPKPAPNFSPNLGSSHLSYRTSTTAKRPVFVALFNKEKLQAISLRWSRFLRQAVKVDLMTKRMIHHEDTQAIHG